MFTLRTLMPFIARHLPLFRPTSFRSVSVCLVGALALAACKPPAPVATPAAEPPTFTLVAEDIITLDANSLSSGPFISGSLQAKKQADLRAEIPAVLLEVLKENGAAVKKGDLLLRLDDTAITQALRSSQEAEHTLSRQLEQAQRQWQRLKTLSEKGAVSSLALEEAQLRVQTAESELTAAKAKVAHDSQQLTRTQIRAPFNGVVADRVVSTGDTLSVGTALIKVVDPASVQFVGYIAADQAGRIKLGLPVFFTLNGRSNPQYTGHIEAINPVVDAQTRQVGVQVALEKGVELTAGLFAEGRIQLQQDTRLTLPEASLISQGDNHYVWQLKNNQLHKTAVTLGARDIQTGDYELVKGLEKGDTLLRHPVGGMVEGAAVQMQATPQVKKDN